MRTIIVNNKEVIVDDEVFEWAKHFKWRLAPTNHVFIHQHRHYIWLHRIVADTPDDLFCDHINRNPLDNRLQNLRNCTKSQNSMNKVTLPNSLGYRGVTFDKRRVGGGRPYGCWVQAGNIRKCYGRYYTAKEAAIKYNEIAKLLHGEFAIFNEV